MHTYGYRPCLCTSTIYPCVGVGCGLTRGLLLVGWGAGQVGGRERTNSLYQCLQVIRAILWRSHIHIDGSHADTRTDAEKHTCTRRFSPIHPSIHSSIHSLCDHQEIHVVCSLTNDTCNYTQTDGHTERGISRYPSVSLCVCVSLCVSLCVCVCVCVDGVQPSTAHRMIDATSTNGLSFIRRRAGCTAQQAPRSPRIDAIGHTALQYIRWPNGSGAFIKGAIPASLPTYRPPRSTHIDRHDPSSACDK